MNYQGKEKIKMVLQGILMVGLLAYLFYNSILAVLFLSPLLLLFWKRKEIEKMKLQKWQLNLEFREALEGISAALCAGYSIENSFYEAKKDLSLIYKEEADIMWELTQITTQIQCNKRVEDLLYDFSRRSHVEDILSFAEVFAMAKRSGGNLILILRQTVKN
ncbi:MAG: pilus assembly protein TadB, partial [Acetivibrio sp.]